MNYQHPISKKFINRITPSIFCAFPQWIITHLGYFLDTGNRHAWLIELRKRSWSGSKGWRTDEKIRMLSLSQYFIPEVPYFLFFSVLFPSVPVFFLFLIVGWLGWLDLLWTHRHTISSATKMRTSHVGNIEWDNQISLRVRYVPNTSVGICKNSYIQIGLISLYTIWACALRYCFRVSAVGSSMFSRQPKQGSRSHHMVMETKEANKEKKKKK